METTINKQSSQQKSMLLVTGSVFGMLSIICFIFHLSPVAVAMAMAQFARHHYFLMSFIFMLVAVILIKNYLDFFIPPQLINATKANQKIKSHVSNAMRNFKKTNKPMNDSNESSLIEKSEISKIRFNEEDVLNDLNFKAARNHELRLALSLGNLYKQKVCIYFDLNGIKKHVITTIWQLDEENVSLKGGVTLPVRKIYKVEY